MLKLQHFFILVSFLVATSLVACEKDEEVSDSNSTQVSGGEVAGGDIADGGIAGGAEESDMGLEGGQILDPEPQLTGGSEGGVEITEDLPTEGGQVAEIDCDDNVDPSDDDSELPEVEDACLPEEDLPTEGGTQESDANVSEEEEVSGGELVEEESEESNPSEG